MATGRTKDLPGFDRLTGFVAFTAPDLSALRVRPPRPPRPPEPSADERSRVRTCTRPGRMSTPRRPTMCPVMSHLSVGAFQLTPSSCRGCSAAMSPARVRSGRRSPRPSGRSATPGCAGRVAQEFGDHPETAVIRMRWARAVAREAFADPVPEPGPGADADGWLLVPRRLPAERASGSSDAGQRERARSAAGGEG